MIETCEHCGQCYDLEAPLPRCTDCWDYVCQDCYREDSWYAEDGKAHVWCDRCADDHEDPDDYDEDFYADDTLTAADVQEVEFD